MPPLNLHTIHLSLTDNSFIFIMGHENTTEFTDWCSEESFAPWTATPKGEDCTLKQRLV